MGALEFGTSSFGCDLTILVGIGRFDYLSEYW